MTPGVHSEAAFEATIERELLESSGWENLPGSAYNAESGLVPDELFAFLSETQPKQWEQLVKIHGGTETIARQRMLRRIGAEIDRYGTIHCLRHGFTDNGVLLRLAFFRPAHKLAPDTVVRYATNRLTVLRQVHYDGSHPSVDLLLVVNGLPTATAELKNPITNQTVENAKKQYRSDRDPKQLLFARRAVVHFAVDPDEVYMTTRLAGQGTRFLPFNRGSKADGSGGKGNPPGDGLSYRTSYLWRDVWQRDNWLELMQRFIHVEEPDQKAGTPVSPSDRLVIFPRYHQWDVVRRGLANARARGAGHNYLIQHSAGSGKSKEIAWLGHALSSLHGDDDLPVFDKVVIVTDRVVLDRQLQDQVYQFEQKRGVVEKIDDKKNSADLRLALAGEGARIIITTIQKFPFVLLQLEDEGQILKARKYAVIVDEAHSSQTGESSRALKEVLGSASPETDDGQPDELVDALAKNIASRGRQPNMSFFAFTATPKAKTLELFGSAGPDGRPKPFHLYSMRQAIEEGFILDVLANYTTYDTYYRLAATAAALEKEFEKGKLAAAIARYVRLHPYAIGQKVAIVVEHYRTHVRHHLSGRAKAMIVTASRIEAVRYKQAVDRYLEEQGYDDLKALVAFSGTVKDPNAAGLEYTEVGMNPRGKAIPDRFEEAPYGVLIVAEKYQTGFDQPLLTAMYVDKRLIGVNAVQTLSRLNRTYPGKPDPFVLDFVNEAHDIQEAFEPYFETTIAEPSDPNVLYDALAKLRDFDVLRDEEIDAFCVAFLTNTEIDSTNPKKRDAAHQLLYVYTDPSRDRFTALPEEAREQFRAAVKRYVRLYAFLSQIIPYVSLEAERCYLYARVLERRLPTDEGGSVDLGTDVLLTHFRIEQDAQTKIGLEGDTDPIVAIGGDGTGKVNPPPIALLFELVELFNDRFGMGLGEEDAVPFDHIRQKGAADPDLKKSAQANTLEQFELAYADKFMEHVLDASDVSQLIFKALMNDEQFRSNVQRLLAEQVYRDIHAASVGEAAE